MYQRRTAHSYRFSKAFNSNLSPSILYNCNMYIYVQLYMYVQSFTHAHTYVNAHVLQKYVNRVRIYAIGCCSQFLVLNGQLSDASFNQSSLRCSARLMSVHSYIAAFRFWNTQSKQQ